MNLIERYIGLAVIRASLLTLLVLVILLVFLGFADEARDLGKGDYEVWDALLVSLLSAPRYAFEIFPVAALIGSLLGLGGLATHGELVAMRSAGVSVRGIVMAVIKAGLLLMLAVFLVGELGAPPAEQLAQELRAEKLHRQVTMRSRYGFWAKDGDAFVNIRRILPGAHIEALYLYRFSPQRRLELATYAESGEYQGDHWVLRGIRQSRFTGTGVEARRLARARWESLLDPALLSVIAVRPTMLALWDLHQYIAFLRRNGQSATAFEVAYWGKLSTPLATLVMLFLGVPFVFGSLRRVGIGQRVFAGTLMGAGFFLLSRAMAYVSLAWDLSPLLAAALPALAFLALGAYLVRRVH